MVTVHEWHWSLCRWKIFGALKNLCLAYFSVSFTLREDSNNTSSWVNNKQGTTEKRKSSAKYFVLVRNYWELYNKNIIRLWEKKVSSLFVIDS